ncbi:hypothetical protein [Corallococcus carmarthensis]|uniref:hypothetical protein n=1 Tax=Corallococcus carmarthensis TaxID=2316728 RepID=UPI001FCA1386|nr:hypothetical protein [Corallococcus carmarthensis]
MFDHLVVPLEDEEALARNEPFISWRTRFLHEAQPHGVCLRELEEAGSECLEGFSKGQWSMEGEECLFPERVLGGSEIR